MGTGKPRATERAWGVEGAILELQKGSIATRKRHLDKNQVKIECVRGWDTYMIQAPPVTTFSKGCNSVDIGGREKLHFLRLVLGWKLDGMHSVSSIMFGLKHFEGRA